MIPQCSLRSAGRCASSFPKAHAVSNSTVSKPSIAVSSNDAVIADVYDGRIGRLWRTGTGIGLPHEPAIDVAFDPDMRQQRGDVFFRAEDHRELGSGHASILAAVRAYVDNIRRTDSLRVRAFVRRAFGSDHVRAALLSVYGMSNAQSRTAGFSNAQSRTAGFSNAQSRTAGFSNAILGIGPDGAVRMVHDRAAPRPWMPRF